VNAPVSPPPPAWRRAPAGSGPSPPPSRHRRWLALGTAAAVAVLALAAHLAWSYLPRVRPGRPAPGGLAARLLTSADFGRPDAAGPSVVLWVAYPHQNLAALERALGEEDSERDRFLAAAARLGGLPELELPRFGPFAAPPSRELVAVSDPEGRRVLVAARVYPTVAVLARLAGAVAGNPWLSGGEVDAFGGTAEVAWDGLLWTVGTVGEDGAAVWLGQSGGAAGDYGGEAARSGRDGGGGDARGRPGGRPEPGEAGAAGTAGPPEPAGPALAILALAEPVSFLPAGRHRLGRLADGLALATEGADDLPTVDTDLLAGAGAAALAVSGPGGPLAGEGEAAAAAALALFPPDRVDGELSLRGLLRRAVAIPGAAVWYRSGGGEPGPARRFLAPLFSGGRSRDASAGTASPFALVATGGDALTRARRLTPEVERLAEDLRLGLWVDPRAAFEAVDPVVDLLEKVPLVPRDDLARWRDWRTVLAPLAGYDAVALGTDGEDLHLRLER